jgi:hypothetical protein
MAVNYGPNYPDPSDRWTDKDWSKEISINQQAEGLGEPVYVRKGVWRQFVEDALLLAIVAAGIFAAFCFGSWLKHGR